MNGCSPVSPRKDSLVLYVGAGVLELDDLLSKLGKYKTGKGCLYIKKLDDVDRDVLTRLVIAGAKRLPSTAAGTPS